MPQVSQTLETLQQANRYQFKLYQQWDSVQLVSAPMFSEAGQYIWAVANGDRREP